MSSVLPSFRRHGANEQPAREKQTQTSEPDAIGATKVA